MIEVCLLASASLAAPVSLRTLEMLSMVSAATTDTITISGM